MKFVLIANKQGLYSKFLKRLKEAENSLNPNSRKSYIPFPVIFEKICRGFSIKKEEAWEVLFLLQNTGFIEIVRFHGIKLLYKIKNDDY